ncbi:MAG: hypothetical protein ARM1_0430 [Candidatus Micrarchaeota archaeon]|nr:MAG: hypothetical protein ARM1_0430 [Candidatus Micrarchaeota archaeon]
MTTVNKENSASDSYELIGISKDELIGISTQLAKKLASNIEDNGYVVASTRYDHYKKHWLRDSSFIAISLMLYVGYIDNDKEALDKALSILSFNMSVIEKSMNRIIDAVDTPLENKDFFKLAIPARVDRNASLAQVDADELNKLHSWLHQYDSLPLFIISSFIAKRIADKDGIKDERLDRVISYIKDNTELFSKYLGKIYRTECSSEWEIEQDSIHAYDLLVIELSRRVLIELDGNKKDIIERSFIGVDNSNRDADTSTPIEFLKKFLLFNGKIIRRKRAFKDLDPSEGVDSGLILPLYLADLLDIDLKEIKEELDSSLREIIDNIKENLEKAGVPLPNRFKGDTYFHGGAWVLLGCYTAAYIVSNPELRDYDDLTYKIFNYVYRIWNELGELPEQIADPRINASSYDPERYLERFGQPPQDLLWSSASFLSLAIALYARDKQIRV